MEVHHHAHTDRKKFKHYLWEFLMLFLAVFCGFLAEYQLEHKIDKEKAKQAIESLVKCLASDTTQLNNIIESNKLIVQNLDSLTLLKNADLAKEENKKKFYEHGTVGFFQDWYFKTNDAAMEQLKSSGTLRLIRKQSIIDNILGYGLKNKITVAQEADCYLFFKESLLDFKKVIDLTHLQDTSIVSLDVTNNFVSIRYKKTYQLLISNDKEKLFAVFNNAALMSVAIGANVQFMQEQLGY